MEAALARSLLPTGRIRALAVTSRERHPLLPAIPTIAESGVPGFESATYWAMLTPAGVPDAVLARVSGATLRWARLPETRALLTEAGFLPIGADGAGWHQTGGELRVPANITPFRLAPCALELNPVENIWPFLRSNKVCNRVVDGYDAILDACSYGENWVTG